mmetsp:Transcript_59684/g.104974  ORF Transcript_59684/g.104974 Transcript_59684/m.104974 type:complete len:223 (-) Transcript_59684:896-1564(-)
MGQLGKTTCNKRMKLKKTLSSQIFVSSPIKNVSLGVLKLLFHFALELPHLNPRADLLIQGLCIRDERNVVEVLRVRDAEAAHAVCVLPLLEVLVEGASAPVAVISADLALVLHAQAVQLVHPVGNGLAVPAQREIQRVVYRGIVIVVFAFLGPITMRGLRQLGQSELFFAQLCLALLRRARLLLLSVPHRSVHDTGHKVTYSFDTVLLPCDGIRLIAFGCSL